MDIKELIEMGKTVTRNCSVKMAFAEGIYYKSEKYAEWLSLATRFLESNFPNDKDTIRFRELAIEANDNKDNYFHTLIAILNAFDKFPPTPIKKEILTLLHDIFMNFNKFDVAIKRRYGDGKRSTMIIDDEHDLQDALFAILKLFESNIIKEEYVPSYAGGKSRVDFFLPEQELIIETKMANNSLRDKEVGEQLIIDFNRYKELNKSNHLICFIYDKDSNINNPQNLIKDLEKLSDKKMSMTVFISPQ